MTASVNSLKERAFQFLLKETFTHIYQAAHDDYVLLARENAHIRQVNASFFTYMGEIYPKKTENGSSIANVQVLAPPLHYSLLASFDTISDRIANAGYTEMTNLFTAILSQSINGIVLDALLPDVLINILKQEFTLEEYALINHGLSQHQHSWQPLEVTKQNIQEIKTHYASSLLLLRGLLMDKLLLAR